MTEISFKNQAGMTLAGRFELPGNCEPPFATVIFAHGLDSGKDSPRGLRVAARLRDIGLATFLFDFTGHGGSEGAREDSTIEQQARDLEAAVDTVCAIETVDTDAIGVNGASSGGLVALMAALEDDRIKTLVLRGPRTDGMAAYAPMFKHPILIIQGEYDMLLPDSVSFHGLLRCDKRLEVVSGADHLFSGPGEMGRVTDLTAWWFKTRLRIGRRRAA